MSEIFSDVGEALRQAVEEGRQQSTRRARFQQWLGAYTLAAHIVEALARRPGLRDVEGAVLRKAFSQIQKAASAGYAQLQRQFASDGICLEDPAHQMQVKRLVFEAVARAWPDSPDEGAALFRSMPGCGNALTDDFAKQIVLLVGYTHEVAELIEQHGETPPGERSMAEDYHLDRLLAAHTVYRECHDAVVPFFNNHLLGRPSRWQSTVAGSVAERSELSATDLVHQIVSRVIYPIVDERHGLILKHFDPTARLSPRDRHLAYRALLANVTGDALSVLTRQAHDLLDECQSHYDHLYDEPEVDSGILPRWLAGQVNYRLDMIYPRPDEYSRGVG